jgi:hypothetical protein
MSAQRHPILLNPQVRCSERNLVRVSLRSIQEAQAGTSCFSTGRGWPPLPPSRRSATVFGRPYDRSALGPVRMHDLLELLRVKDSALGIFDLDVTNTHARPFSGKPQDILRVRDPCCHRASRQAAHKPIRRRHGRHADKHIEGGPERDSGSGALPSDVKSRSDSLIPNRILKRVERCLQIPSPVAVGLRKPPARDVHLEG